MWWYTPFPAIDHMQIIGLQKTSDSCCNLKKCEAYLYCVVQLSLSIIIVISSWTSVKLSISVIAVSGKMESKSVIRKVWIVWFFSIDFCNSRVNSVQIGVQTSFFIQSWNNETPWKNDKTNKKENLKFVDRFNCLVQVTNLLFLWIFSTDGGVSRIEVSSCASGTYWNFRREYGHIVGFYP